MLFILYFIFLWTRQLFWYWNLTPKPFLLLIFFSFFFFYHLNTVCDCNFVETVSSSWRPGKKSEALTFGTLFIVDSFKLPHRTSPMSISTEFSLTLHLDCMLDKRKAFAWWSERHLVMPGSFRLLRLSSAHLTRQLQINLLTVVILFQPFHWNLQGLGVSHSSVRTGYDQGCLHSLGPPDHQGASWLKKKWICRKSTSYRYLAVARSFDLLRNRNCNLCNQIRQLMSGYHKEAAIMNHSYWSGAERHNKKKDEKWFQITN